MYFDRFDIAEAYYLYLSAYHGGQGSREYARLCRLLRSFRPRPSLRSQDDLGDNARDIYDALVARHGERS
jgi:hypothetical protein